MFGSLERGLDKVITMLTPSKRRALRDGPRKIKVYTFLVTGSVSHVKLLAHREKHFYLSLPPGTVQCYSDQPDQPRPGPEPDPLHPAGEKR